MRRYSPNATDTKPVVKVNYAMPVTKFDADTSSALKAAFVTGLGNGVAAADIKIVSATFQVKSKISFPDGVTFDEADFKSSLAKDLKVGLATPPDAIYFKPSLRSDYPLNPSSAGCLDVIQTRIGCTRVEAPGKNLSTLKRDQPRSILAFKFNLRRYSKVDVSQITATVAASRRHLLAGVTVDYTISGIAQFGTAKSMTAVAKSASALQR